jgi:hypothetical protein
MFFKDFLINKAVFEARYAKGYKFWDKAGEAMIEIENTAPEWTCEKRDKNSVGLVNKKRRMTATFGWDRLWVDQLGVHNLNQIKIHSDALFKIIIKHLQIKEIERIGNRYWLVLPCKSEKQAESIVSKGRVFDSKLEKIAVFGDNIVSKDFTLVIKDKDLTHRIACGAASRNPDKELDKNKEFAQFNPLFSILVDVDIFITKTIKDENFKPSDFIQKMYKRIESDLTKLFK